MALLVLATKIVAKRLEDLIVWQLGNELREKVHALSAMEPAASDFKFRNQLTDAASSITRNVAEGWGRYRHREFAYFLNIARGSLFEVADDLRDGVKRNYWKEDTVREHCLLCYRAISATTKLIRYLRANPDAPFESL